MQNTLILYKERELFELERLPFEDITILDLTWVIAGPSGTRMFRDLGATVIKVESSNSIDVLRSGSPRKGNEDFTKEGGWGFNDLNRGKMDISLNLKSVKGREIFEDLVRLSDIVVCNFGVGAFKKLRLTFDELSKLNPSIIVMNASGMGDWGPYSFYITFAPILQAMTGLERLIGYEGSSERYGVYPPIADYMGGLAICNYLAAALEYRRRTGEGQFIDLSQCEAAVSYLGHILLDWQVNKIEREPKGNHHYSDDAAPHNVYKCAGDDSQWCAITVVTEDEWKAFAKIVDPCENWTLSEKFSSKSRRIKYQKELDEHISSWTRQKTPAEVGEILQAAGVSGAPVQSALDILQNDLHLKERDFFKKVLFPRSDKTPESLLFTSLPFRIQGLHSPSSSSPAPAIGADTEYVVKTLLGKTQEYFHDAYSSGAFV